mgnify:CR=1 FL=1
MTDLLSKGNFRPINRDFLVEGHEILEEVAAVQEKWGKEDTDTFINELRDSIAGYYLGYDLVNTEKHGFDCKKSEKEDAFLEVKSASFAAKEWNATFNDTTIEKAEYFKSEKVFLCLAVWKNASNLLFLVYGQNPEIGDFLKEKVEDFLNDKGGVRSTQSISMHRLISEYGFDIICVNKSKEEVKSILGLKSRSFLSIPDEKFLTLNEYMAKNGNAVKILTKINEESRAKKQYE